MEENIKTALSGAVLVAIDYGEYDIHISLGELSELAKSAGMTCLAQVVQRRQRPDKATAIGAGKLGELSEFCGNIGAELIVFDQELSALQLRNIEGECGIPVIDRTMLILEIFSRRALTAEGKLQVELAKSRYMLPRLTGMGVELSRLGGGGGGAGAGARRGSGETLLELNRRHIRERVRALERQLAALAARRENIRRRRKKDETLTVAIVGYTNVGKSTLLNALTGACVPAEDKLFATLDPTARGLVLPDGRKVLLIDTVGLVRRLPHHLVQAFRSTLEEAVYADLILNVCDISSPDAPEQIRVTRELLDELKIGDTPVINLLNKADRLSQPLDTLGEGTALISAKTGGGLEDLLEKISRLLPQGSRRLKMLIPYQQSSLIAEIRQEGKIYSEEFTPEGTVIDALVNIKIIPRTRPFMVD